MEMKMEMKTENHSLCCSRGYPIRNEFSSNAKAAAAGSPSSSFHCTLPPAARGCSIKLIVALSSEAARQHPAEVPFCIALV
jgi:hypothetical protein